MLISELHSILPKNAFDFLYLRMDFINECNVGYAFINFTKHEYVCLFAYHFIAKKWMQFQSDKKAMVNFANIQGKDKLIEKFKYSSVMEEKESFQPVLFNHEGKEFSLQWCIDPNKRRDSCITLV